MDTLTFSSIVYVVDDDASVRSALQRLLASVGLECETFATTAEFLERANRGISGCLITDVRMPGQSGLDLQKSLLESGNDIPVLFVTAYADVPLTVRAMKAGALQVLTKPFEDQVLLDAVHEALDKGRDRFGERAQREEFKRRHGTLTAREREVLRLVAIGLPNKQIADVLGTSEATVKAHRAQVMHKMEARSLADLVRMFDKLGLSPTQP